MFWPQQFWSWNLESKIKKSQLEWKDLLSLSGHRINHLFAVMKLNIYFAFTLEVGKKWARSSMTLNIHELRGETRRLQSPHWWGLCRHVFLFAPVIPVDVGRTSVDLSLPVLTGMSPATSYEVQSVDLLPCFVITLALNQPSESSVCIVASKPEVPNSAVMTGFDRCCHPVDTIVAVLVFLLRVMKWRHPTQSLRRLRFVYADDGCNTYVWIHR